jgi:hypothetical protein
MKEGIEGEVGVLSYSDNPLFHLPLYKGEKYGYKLWLSPSFYQLYCSRFI